MQDVVKKKKEHYTLAQRYEFYVRVAETISHEAEQSAVLKISSSL